ncbi:hypothetical protein ADUPG1_007782 [Aduncisulcus paluster]|uniref:Phosphodiesterase n=1 Tax=Aduncisulcus paluster TaxID=2918883 RepID=A0ABQ5KQY9_9EUKA|nr:hypothetical protein ADUPG1_007782 [Aduncisulcus paluster]
MLAFSQFQEASFSTQEYSIDEESTTNQILKSLIKSYGKDRIFLPIDRSKLDLELLTSCLDYHEKKCKDGNDIAYTSMNYDVRKISKEFSNVFFLTEILGLLFTDILDMSDLRLVASGSDVELSINMGVYGGAARKSEQDKIIRVSCKALLRYFYLCERNYTSSAAYHNQYHGASHMHLVTMFCMNILSYFRSIGMPEVLTKGDVLIFMISAASHDLRHPGLSQTFLQQYGHPIAMLHGPFSPLERHHVSVACQILLECGLFEQQDYLIVRRSLFRLIMITAMDAKFDFASYVRHCGVNEWFQHLLRHKQLPKDHCELCDSLQHPGTSSEIETLLGMGSSPRVTKESPSDESHFSSARVTEDVSPLSSRSMSLSSSSSSIQLEEATSSREVSARHHAKGRQHQHDSGRIVKTKTVSESECEPLTVSAELSERPHCSCSTPCSPSQKGHGALETHKDMCSSCSSSWYGPRVRFVDFIGVMFIKLADISGPFLGIEKCWKDGEGVIEEILQEGDGIRDLSLIDDDESEPHQQQQSQGIPMGKSSSPVTIIKGGQNVSSILSSSASLSSLSASKGSRHQSHPIPAPQGDSTRSLKKSASVQVIIGERRDRFIGSLQQKTAKLEVGFIMFVVQPILCAIQETTPWLLGEDGIQAMKNLKECLSHFQSMQTK